MLDERVDGDRVAGRIDDQRIDVDAGDVWPLPGDPAERHEDAGQQIPVDCSLTPERIEQPLRGELVDHLVGGDLVERRWSEHDVGDGLGQDPAHAEHDGGPELLVAQHPADQLTIALHHRRHEHGDLTVVRSRGGEQVDGGPVDGVGVGEPQANQSTLGLVGDALAVELRDHGIAEPVGGPDGFVGGGHQPLLGDRDAVTGQQVLGVALGERAATHRRRSVMRVRGGFASLSRPGRSAWCARRRRAGSAT